MVIARTGIARDPTLHDNLRAYIATMRKAGKHGEAFHYVSTNTDLLGWILERVSGTDFATLLSREIWQPMGAEFDAYITLDRLGAPQTDGGLCVTTRDLCSPFPHKPLRQKISSQPSCA